MKCVRHAVAAAEYFIIIIMYTTQHKDRVLQLGYYIQITKTKQNNYKQTYRYTYTKSLINQLVTGENGQRRTINNAQTPPLGA